jgi:hypothetical protein
MGAKCDDKEHVKLLIPQSVCVPKCHNSKNTQIPGTMRYEMATYYEKMQKLYLKIEGSKKMSYEMVIFVVNNVDFDVTDQLLTRYSAFVRYWRKCWSVMGQYVIYRFREGL